MLRRTHLAIGFAVALYFLPFVTNEVIFVPVVLLASILPEIDALTFKGKRIFKGNKPLQGHRGIFHTYTSCVIISLLFAFFYPIFALPFFLGYSFHLFADSFTKEGIRPFWPMKATSSGVVVTGGQIDKVLFVTFIMVDIMLLIALFV